MRTSSYAIRLTMMAYLLLALGKQVRALPTLYISSIVENPSQRLIRIIVTANDEVQVRTFGTIKFTANPVSEDAPYAFNPPNGGTFMEIWNEPFTGPGEIGSMYLYMPESGIPDNALYQLGITFITSPIDLNGNQIPIQISGGWLIVRQKPFLLGDLTDDGKIDIQDATLSLRLMVGLISPTPFDDAAGDFNHDGRLTLQDTQLILKQSIGPL